MHGGGGFIHGSVHEMAEVLLWFLNKSSDCFRVLLRLTWLMPVLLQFQLSTQTCDVKQLGVGGGV